MTTPRIYGIGNPLVDVSVSVEDSDLEALDLSKGTMCLIDTERRRKILRHIEDKPVTYGCGGSAPNTMITIAALGRPTALGGAVGEDDLGGVYRDRLEETGVKDEMAVCPGETGTSIVLVTPDGERTMCTFLGVCNQFSPGSVNLETLSGAEWIHFTGYMWDTEKQKAAVRKAIEAARTAGTKVSFDVADPFAVERHGEDFRGLIKDRPELIFANRTEAQILTGERDPEAAARALSRDCALVAVKDGKNGSVIANGESVERVPADAAHLVDSTGAGDNYAAGFLFALTDGANADKAAGFASYVAARIVEQRGAQFEENESKAILTRFNTQWAAAAVR